MWRLIGHAITVFRWCHEVVDGAQLRRAAICRWLAIFLIIEIQKQQIDQNTSQFVEGLPANNVLLIKARGTDKLSLIKAFLNQYAGHGLRLIDVDKDDLAALQDIVDLCDCMP